MPSGLNLSHEFVEFIPSKLEDGIVYISIPFKTATHRCCCGCGGKVVTRLSPRHWKLIFDGETISLNPSIGNWNFECRSHYWIEGGRVKWASGWTDEEVTAGQDREEYEEEIYLSRVNSSLKSKDLSERESEIPLPSNNLWQQIKKWISSRFL